MRAFDVCVTQNVYQDYDPDNPNVEWAEFWGQKPPGSEDSESSVKPGWMVEIEKLQNSGNSPAKDVTQNVPALDDTNVSGMQTLGMSPARSESVQTPTAQASSGLGKRPDPTVICIPRYIPPHTQPYPSPSIP